MWLIEADSIKSMPFRFAISYGRSQYARLSPAMSSAWTASTKRVKRIENSPDVRRGFLPAIGPFIRCFVRRRTLCRRPLRPVRHGGRADETALARPGPAGAAQVQLFCRLTGLIPVTMPTEGIPPCAGIGLVAATT